LIKGVFQYSRKTPFLVVYFSSPLTELNGLGNGSQWINLGIPIKMIERSDFNKSSIFNLQSSIFNSGLSGKRVNISDH